MHPRIPLPDEIASAPFSVDEGRAAGLGRSRMSGGHLVRPFHGVRADSPAETLLRLDLVDLGLPEPEVNVPISDRYGQLIAIADLASREYRVIVEYDGDHHRTDRAQNARDVDRVDDLVRAGWRVIRCNATHVGARRIERLLRVRQALIAAGWRPST